MLYLAHGLSKLKVHENGGSSFGVSQVGSFGMSVSYSVFCLQEVTWALYKGKPPDRVALEDRCAVCFTSWQRAFSYQTWEEFLDAYKSKKGNITEIVGQVREKVAKDAQVAGDKGPSVMEIRSIQLEISKSMLIANEKELRQKTGQPRLPKSLLRGLPCLEIPKENGDGSETVYVFKKPNAEFREATVILRQQ